jgi:biotin operon repressor
MSNHLISTTYSRDLGSLTRKAVMVLLSDKASDDGSGIYASKQTMADELCTSKQTVITVVKSLMVDGLLIEAGQRLNANGYTIEYAINVDALEALPLVGSAQRKQSRKLTGQAALPVKLDDRTSQAALPEPSLNLPPIDKANALSPPALKLVEAEEPEVSLKPEHVVEAWNAMAGRTGLPKVRKLDADRTRKLNARIRQNSIDEFTEAIGAIERSPFLRGEKDWRGAGFDFLLSPSKFNKLLEGQYDESNSRTAASPYR